MSENTTGANILAKITQLAGTDGVIALKNGMQKVIPFTILGSIFLLFSNFSIWAAKSGTERRKRPRCAKTLLTG